MTATDAARVAAVRQRCAFVLLGSVQTTLIFTLASIAVPLPAIGREFGLQRADLILLSAAYGLTFAGLLLFGGRLADRYGGRRALTAGLVLFAAALAVAPLAPGFGTLLAARFAQGAGAALIAPAAMAVLRAAFPSSAAYGRAMVTWGGLSVLGATAGNLLSGVISALSSWRWTFAVPLVVALAALALTPRLLPDTTPSRGRTLDLTGALLATAGITLASYGLVVTDTRPWSSAGVLVPLLAGAALLVAFRYAERRARDPLLPPRFLFDRRRALALAAIALSACGTAMTFVVLSLHLQQARDWSPLQTSAAFVPFAVALIASGRAAGPLIGRYGARSVTAAGLGTGAAGLALLALTGTGAHIPYGYGLLPGLVLLPAGTAASFAGAAVLATEGVPQQQTGLAGGVLNTAMEAGPTVLFAILLTLGSDASSLAATGAALAAAALLNHRIK
ncbi:MFS transporter [Streptomyces azureus]|uniref:Major facilitator superfamily permease n=1 Tax=Streptomyces azureus TaxID=146537 RepID=A0A0K8PKW0_STRAJ|nr:MFS transporter [Streptomyces azureus]GAP48522.1 major facilitator superfamily permease [Streptomyces azureus]